MNSLSWMIYLADVVGAINALAVAGALLSVASVPIWTIRNAWLRDFHDSEGVVPLRVGPPLIALLFCSTLAAIAPTSSTVYAIAASEMGESALNSETGGKAVEALNAWLDRQIEGDEE